MKQKKIRQMIDSVPENSELCVHITSTYCIVHVALFASVYVMFLFVFLPFFHSPQVVVSYGKRGRISKVEMGSLPATIHHSTETRTANKNSTLYLCNFVYSTYTVYKILKKCNYLLSVKYVTSFL